MTGFEIATLTIIIARLDQLRSYYEELTEWPQEGDEIAG